LPPRAFRRRAALVCSWSGPDLVVDNYATGVRTSVTPVALEILDFLSEWRTLPEIQARFPAFTRPSLTRMMAALAARALVVGSGRPRADRMEAALQAWAPWNPAAGLLHFSTKDVAFVQDYDEGERLLREQARRQPPPSPLKAYAKARFQALPAPPRVGALPEVLLRRRTWRRFSARPVRAADLATLLGLTFGIQGWMALGELGRVPLKTSPSGGARHSIEAYVLVLRVAGLGPGLYHYAPDRHGLERLRRGATPAQIERYLPAQWWYRGAGAVVFLTSVFPRVMWRYDYPRAYRAVLIEAGHLCQTFLLLATWLGLAPFCTMALADSRIERDLGLDGVTESVLYAAGVGSRPPGVESAQAPAPRRRGRGPGGRARLSGRGRPRGR
jgi:SagB-type dehydrogenase family enzyme